MEVGTIKLSKEQAENIINNVNLANRPLFAMETPKTNGCIRLAGDVTLRKLPVKFRGNDKRSKAFRLKGPVQSVRRISKHIGGTWTMDVKPEKVD